jgi:cellulose synthase/poly-beta-1,6-N-acetylglucosamine synthase-like glycosyltransferase
MTAFLIAFCTTALVLWLSVFGYYLSLHLVVWGRRGKPEAQADRRPAQRPLPEILVVVPTLNEEDCIQAKLGDLRRTDYPAALTHIVVVDGNSVDGTDEIVRAQRRRDARLELLCVADARRKQHQVIRALQSAEQEYVVFTDADSALEPDCVRNLIRRLEEDKETGIAAALVVPRTELLEERVHWNLVNALWWLEGEATSATGFSGVCYAVRRSAVADLHEFALAEDIHLAFAASASGYRVRLCPEAQAHELRVPRSAAELVSFRRRRGTGYVFELVRGIANRSETRGRAACWMRLWHLLVVPKVTAALVVCGVVLGLLGRWQLPAVTFALLGLSALGMVCLPSLPLGREQGYGRLFLAVIRHLLLTGVSLFTLRKQNTAVTQTSLGGLAHRAAARESCATATTVTWP